MLCRILRLTTPRLMCHFRLVVAVRVRESKREKKREIDFLLFSLFPTTNSLGFQSINPRGLFSIRALDNL